MKFVERMWSKSNGDWIYYIDGWMPATDKDAWTDVYVEMAKVVLERDCEGMDEYDKVAEIDYAIFCSDIRCCGYTEEGSYRDTFADADGRYGSKFRERNEYRDYIYSLATFEPKELDLVFQIRLIYYNIKWSPLPIRVMGRIIENES